jgi:DNA-binding protein WhiA
MIGAINSMLNYENTRVLKETRNSINRTTNCEMANLDRTLEAVMEQRHICCGYAGKEGFRN